MNHHADTEMKDIIRYFKITNQPLTEHQEKFIRSCINSAVFNAVTEQARVSSMTLREMRMEETNV